MPSDIQLNFVYWISRLIIEVEQIAYSVTNFYENIFWKYNFVFFNNYDANYSK